MKIALDWIADYLSPVPAAEVAADALMNAGLPIESIEPAVGVKAPTQVLDVEVTSNRTDCFCHVGLARELGALTGGTFKLPAISIAEGAMPASSLTSVEIRDLPGCPYYSARLIRNVKVGPSPDWLRRRLESVGVRSINNVVDVTNFVLMELGQPLHAFDLDKLEGKRIVVRRAQAGEKLMAIDGREYPLEPSMLVIADGQKPAAIAGVMGGKPSEVTEATTSVLLESAHFEPLTVRTTSRALTLKSDASYRFERGIDPTMAELASRRAAQLILQVAGGELAQGVVSAGSDQGKPAQVSMRLSRFQKVIGIPIACDRALAILSALGFSPWIDEGATQSNADDLLYARVPPHRLDVSREIDLIEEIARVNGYQHVPTLDRVSHEVTPESVREKAMRAVRAAMVEGGFSEAVTVTFIAEADGAPFAQAGVLIHPQHGGWKADVLRPSLLPSLLAARRTNQYAGLADAHLFETGSTFVQPAPGGGTLPAPKETRMLAAVAGELSTVTGLLPLLADRLNPGAKFRIDPQEHPVFVGGASGVVMLEISGRESAVGRAGLFTADLQKKYDLRHAAAGIELDLEALLAIFEPTRRAAPVPRYPGISRDLSVVVEESVRWAAISGAIRAAKLTNLHAVEFVTTFRNAQVGAGKKSLTLTLEFRDPSRTLTSEEADAQVARAVDLLAKEFNAVLRA